MTKRLLAGLLALPVLAATASPAAAQMPGCAAGGYGAANCGYGVGYGLNNFCSMHHLGCGGFCFKFLGRLHQDSPLVNYGPYYGYPPFEPYGPWGADLRYNGGCHGGRCGGGLFGGGLLGGLFHGRSFGGGYALGTLKNVFHRIHPLAHRSKWTGGCYGADCGCAGGTGVASAAPAAVSAPAALPPAAMPAVK